MTKQPLLHPITQQPPTLQRNSRTLAGQIEVDHDVPECSDLDIRESRIKAINQVFGLFRVNYHNQFTKAYPNTETLNQAKRLWFKLLDALHADQILWAAEQAMKSCEYLPSACEILKSADAARANTLGLSNSYSAYLEACQAPSPKQNYSWSHPIVYLAGKKTGWYQLAHMPERSGYPLFKIQYDVLYAQLSQGITLNGPEPKALPESASSSEGTPSEKLTRNQQCIRLRKLRETLKL